MTKDSESQGVILARIHLRVALNNGDSERLTTRQSGIRYCRPKSYHIGTTSPSRCTPRCDETTCSPIDAMRLRVVVVRRTTVTIQYRLTDRRTKKDITWWFVRNPRGTPSLRRLFFLSSRLPESGFDCRTDHYGATHCTVTIRTSEQRRHEVKSSPQLARSHFISTWADLVVLVVLTDAQPPRGTEGGPSPHVMVLLRGGAEGKSPVGYVGLGVVEWIPYRTVCAVCPHGYGALRSSKGRMDTLPDSLRSSKGRIDDPRTSSTRLQNCVKGTTRGRSILTGRKAGYDGTLSICGTE
ncbi:hypothetical protein BJV78DRAFT_1158344 [Lactifluus subvellereus]|nr:hypothetical protein BJV78DRAFT_1158344 [Lactifluus subvellereus]